MSAGHGEAHDRPQPVQHPPHGAGDVRRLRDPARLARSAVGVERARDRDVGHRAQARRPAAVQHAGRRVARAGARLRQRLVDGSESIEDNIERALEGEGAGLHRAEMGSVPGPMAQLHPSRGRGPCRALRPRDAGGAGAGLRAAGRGASPARADACDPHRPADRRIRHRLVRRAVPVRQHRTGRRGAAQRADPDRDRRGDLLQGGVRRRRWRRAPPTSQSGHLQLRRHQRDAGHRRDGAAARGGDRAAQLQQHAGRRCGDGPAVGDDSELLDRRVLRQSPAGLRRDRDAAI